MYALSIVLSLVLADVNANENWPEYRGPTGDGQARGKGLPVEWGEKKNIRWKTAIHDKGWSSPVIWGKQIWVTTGRADGKELFAVCIDRDSGEISHDVRVFEVAKPFYCHPFNSYASPTPAIEAGRVYVHYGSAGTACLDTETGKIVWDRRDLPCNHFRAGGSSPILAGDLLILSFDGIDVQYMVGLDKKTGKTVWKKDRETAFPSTNGDMKKAYATPILIDVAGKRQLISSAAHASMAYDPESGKEIWRVIHRGMNAASRPLSAGGRLYFIAPDGGKGLLAVRPDGAGDVTGTHVDWVYSKGIPSRPSLLWNDGFIYMISNGGILTCLDAKTGKPREQIRLEGKFTASPVQADGRMYFPSEDGPTYVVEPGQPMRVVAVNRLDDGFMASPAIAGKVLFLRTRTHLYAIERGAKSKPGD